MVRLHLRWTVGRVVAVVVAAALIGANAHAVPSTSALKQEVGELEQQSRTLTVRYRTQASSSEQLAEHRLVDAQVLYNLRDYTRAAIILLDYVNKYKNTRGYDEALFYLADSLFHKRDFLTSRRYFRQLFERGKGRYYQDALQRLIELALKTDDMTHVQEYLGALANIPPYELKPSVPYVRGKFYYFRDQLDPAIASFNGIAQGKQYYLQAQYFVGATLVKKKDYPAAIKVFSELLRVEPKEAADKHVRQLTHLALGRLYYEKGKISEAIDQYQKVSRRSKAFDTALYEICWAYVKAGEFQRALRALDLLVLAQPNSPFIPEVRVLQGNLLIRLKHWGRATDLFTKTRETFVPLRKRMVQLMKEHSDPNVFFDVLLKKNLGDLAVTIQVPKIAVDWVRSDERVRRALGLVNDVRSITASIKEAQELMKRLERAINSPAKIKVFPEFATARASALQVENRTAVARQGILERERLLVIGVATAGERGRLEQLAAQRKALGEKINKLPKSLDSFERRRKAKVSRLSRLEKEVSRLLVVVEHLQAQLVASEKYFADTAAQKSTGARESFRKEVSTVRMMIAGLNAEVEELSRALGDAKQMVGVGGAQEVAERSIKALHSDAVKQEHQLLASLRPRLVGAAGAEFDDLSALLARTDGIQQTVGAFSGRLEREVEQKLGNIRVVLKEESGNVGQYEQMAGSYSQRTDNVAGGITYLGFRRLGQRFYEIVVRADVGIIDVAWALKDEKTKEVSRLVKQQKLDLKLLDEEFREVLTEK
ncbi:MAG: tetratricopeptide repeat protein [Deltaproteobacteria bacterium]|nr:tetratricopeptide repeat protein [Deltaproteobacteria bacterium]